MAYPISKLWSLPLLRLLIKRINGVENIPRETAFIIVSNHEKLIDPLYIIYAIVRKLNKKVHFIASPTWWFLGETICRQWAGCIPLFGSEQASKEAKEYVKKGKIVGIFPEGRSTAKKRYLKSGVIKLSIETKTPILPMGIKTSYFPFSSVISIGKLVYLKKNKNIKKQTIDLMRHVYRLRNGAA